MNRQKQREWWSGGTQRAHQNKQKKLTDSPHTDATDDGFVGVSDTTDNNSISTDSKNLNIYW